jgi:hypothetical protein
MILLMPVYYGAYRWVSFKQSEASWQFMWRYKITVNFFGYALSYGQDGSKYPPDEEPQWRPLRDFWKFLKEGNAK